MTGILCRFAATFMCLLAVGSPALRTWWWLALIAVIYVGGGAL